MYVIMKIPTISVSYEVLTSTNIPNLKYLLIICTSNFACNKVFVAVTKCIKPKSKTYCIIMQHIVSDYNISSCKIS